MNCSPEFTPIDPQSRPMAETFHYYTQIAPTSYTVNVSMDVTRLRRVLKKQGYKLFPAYLYLVTRAVNQLEELRVGIRDGVLGHWKTLTPAYPQFHKDDRTTSLLWTEWSDNFRDFHDAYLTDTQTYGDSHGILTSKGVPREFRRQTVTSSPAFPGSPSTVFHCTIMASRTISCRALRRED